MPIYSIKAPDGNTYRIEGPEGASQEDVARAVIAQNPEAAIEPKTKTGLGAALSKGLEGLISSGRTAVGAITGDAGEAARAGIARGENIQRRYANQTDMGKVAEAYNKDGILSAGRELVSQIPYALAEQAPNLAAMAGGARLGAMAGSVFGPVGTAIGGSLGAFAPSFLQQMGGNVERQAQEGQPVSTGTAAAAAVPQAGLDLASQYLAFGGKLVQKLTGIPTQALFSKSAAQVSKLADERLLTTLAKGTVIGGVAEIPTEIAQQMIERAQAGLSLTSPDALKEYGETAYQVGLLAPLGALGRLSERSGARQQVAQTAQEQAAAQAAQEQQALQEQEQQQAQLLNSQEYAQQKKAEYDAAVAERQRLSDASKAPEGADPLAVADAAEAAKALKAFDKNVMGPLVEEMRRVRALHPQFFPAPTPPAPVTETPAPTGAQAAAAVAPTPTGEETDTAYVAPYVQFLMRTPDLAQQIVDNAEELPGLTPQQSSTVRSVLALHLKPKKRTKKASPEANVTEEGMSPERMEEIQAHAEAIMESPELAADMVMKGEQLPGLTPEENALFLDMLQQRLAQEELDAAMVSGEGFDVETETPAKKTKGKKAPPPAEEGEPNYAAIDGAQKGTGTFTSRIVRGERPPQKTREELITDFRIAKATRDRIGMQQAVDAMRALISEQTPPLGAETTAIATPLPRSVDRSTDARIARGQAFAQLLMAKPADVEFARGRLLERLTTDIEAGSGRRIPQSERYQIAAQANPILDGVLQNKTPENARKAQDALNSLYNRFVSPGAEPAAPTIGKTKIEEDLPVEKGAPDFEEQEPRADIRAASELAVKSLLRDAEMARDKARATLIQTVREKMGADFDRLEALSEQVTKMQAAMAARALKIPGTANEEYTSVQQQLQDAQTKHAELEATVAEWTGEPEKAPHAALKNTADQIRRLEEQSAKIENQMWVEAARSGQKPKGLAEPAQRKALRNRLNVARRQQAKLRAKLEEAKAAAMADPNIADPLRAANRAVGDLEKLLEGNEKTGFSKQEQYLATLQIRNPELQAYQKMLVTERKDKREPFVGPRRPRIVATEGPTAPEVRAESDAKRMAEQKRLEAIARARRSLSGVRVSFEERNLKLETQAKTRAKLEAAAKDQSTSVEERRDAQAALDEFDAAIAASTAKGDLTKALIRRNSLQAQIKALNKKLADPSTLLSVKQKNRVATSSAIQARIDSGEALTERQKAYVARNGLTTQAQVEAERVAALEQRLIKLGVKLAAAERKVANYGGAQITPLLTKEEVDTEAKATATDRRIDRVQAKLNKGQALNAQEKAFAKEHELKPNNAQVEGVEGEIRERERNRIQGKLDRNQALTDEEFEFVEKNRMLANEEIAKLAAKQKDRRATSPVTQERSSAPSQLYMGNAEDTSRTKTRRTGPFESTKKTERNTTVGKKDQQAANAAAPGATMGPAKPSFITEREQQEQLLQTLKQKVEELETKKENAKAALDEYNKRATATWVAGATPVFIPSKADDLKANYEKLTRELSVARQDVARFTGEQDAVRDTESLLEDAQERVRNLKEKVARSNRNIDALTKAEAAGKPILGTNGQPIDFAETLAQLKKVLKERETALAEANKDAQHYRKELGEQAGALEETGTLPEGARSRSKVIAKSEELEAFEAPSLARGVEVESPDLSAKQREHIANDNLRAALRDISDDANADPLNRAVARKLSLLLDFTHVAAVDNLTDGKGNAVLGRAISTEVELDAQTGMTQEVLLHESTHAAVDRVLSMPEHKLTPMQLAAKRELKALFESAKRDPSITSLNAKSSLKEFAAEVLSNRNLQEQLRRKKWTVSDAFRGFISTILRLIGFTKAETDTMLGAGIKAVEALMVPSSKRGLISERALSAISAQGVGVARSSAQKDIAALHNGSNSMRQFAEQFGPDIKAKDRTPEDAERIGENTLVDIANALLEARNDRIRKSDPDAANQLGERAKKLSKYIALPTANSLDYRVRMSDGKLYDENNPLHYVEATVADLAHLEAQNDASLRLQEAGELSKKRLGDYLGLVKELVVSDDFTSVERALIAKAAGKFSVISDDKGRLKLVEIAANNRHNVAVVSAADAAFVVQKLREGLPLKQAFLEGLQDNADRNAKQNLLSHKTGWKKFEQSDTEQAAQELNAGAAGTPWCTGAYIEHARGQIQQGDFYIYYDNGRPEVAVRMQGNRIGEVRGNSPNQSINTKQQQIADDFLRAKNFDGAEEYLDQFTKKNILVDLAKAPETVNPKTLVKFDLPEVDSDTIRNWVRFSKLDGHASGLRAKPTDDVVEFFKDRLTKAVENAMLAGYYPTDIEYSGSKAVADFNGREFDVDPDSVVAVKALDVFSSAAKRKSQEWFPNLEYAGTLTLFTDAKFAKLVSIDSLDVLGNRDITVVLPSEARIGELNSRGVNITIQGATVIRSVNARNSNNDAFNVRAPSVRYIPNEQTYKPTYLYPLRKIADSSELQNTYGHSEAVLEELAARLPSPIPEAFSAREGTLGAEHELAAAILSQTNTLADFAKVNKVINTFAQSVKRLDRLPEEFGTIDAPNRIAENPPFGDLTEAPEVPSYARAAQYTSNDALSTLAQRVVSQPKGWREQQGPNVMLKLEMKTTDMRAGIREALKAGAKAMGNDKLFTQAMYSVIKADQKMPLVMAALSNGPLKLYEDAKGFKGVTTTGRDSAKDVFEAISKIPDTYGDGRAKTALATTYMIAQRATNRGLARLDTGALGVTQQQLDDAMRAVNADPALKRALENVRTKYNAYNAGMIQFLVDTGALPKAKGEDLLRYGDYVPFYRVRPDGVAELVFGKEQTITVGDVRYQPHLAQLKGGEEKILPLDQSIYRNTMLLTDKAMTNMAARNVAYALQAFGLTPTKDTMPIHRGQGPSGPDIIRFTQEPDPSIEGDNGDRWVQVNTKGTSMEGIPAELVVKSLEGAHLTLPAFLKWGGIAGDWLRAGVTRTPVYLLRQLFRDPMAAAFTTGLNYGPLRAIFKANKEYLKLSAGASATGAKLIEKGLVQSGIFTGDPDDISKFALQLASGKDFGAIDKLFAMTDRWAINADTATRSLVYDNAIANGLSEVEADMATMESMNFYKRGLSPTVQYASRLIPFFNSQIQGLNVLYKAARGQMPFNEQLAIKRKFINNAMLLMGVGVAYAMAMDDDDYYKNAKPKDRYSNFFLHLPGVDEPVKLPIPYESGWFFSAAVAAVDAIKGETDGKQQWQALRDIFLLSVPGYSSMFAPQLIKPIAEVWSNKQFYNGQDLESKRLQNLTPDQRYNRNTTELAKAVSKAVPILSPIQIEHIVSGYLGQLPIMAMAAADGLFTPDQSVEEPTRRMSERPLVGSSFQRKYGGADADVVYDLATDALQAKASLDSLLNTGKAQDAKEFRKEHMAEIAVAPLAKQYETIMGTLRKQEEIIRASKSFTADQKRERIDNIDKQRQLQSEKFLQAIRRAEAAVSYNSAEMV